MSVIHIGKSRTKSSFFIKKSDITGRLDPSYHHNFNKYLEAIEDSAFPIKRLGSHLTYLQYGLSNRALTEPVGLPMLRMNNIQSNAWDTTSLKYIELSKEESELYLLKKGDILFNRTNSKELVGKCQVFDLEGSYVYASYLIRIRTNPEKLTPKYIEAFLATQLGRIQIDAVSRQIAGMTNINAEEIKDLLIPIPQIKEQARITDLWTTAIENKEKSIIESKQLLASIDNILLEELGIQDTPSISSTLDNRIFKRSFKELSGERFDPTANQDKRKDLELNISRSTYPVKPLRDLVKPDNVSTRDIAEDEIYLGLENIDSSIGNYVSTSQKETISSALHFNKGQILFPKLRPYLNKTSCAEFSGVCSTEFHVFNSIGISADYLTSFLRSKMIVSLTSLLMTGNTLPRLQTRDIEHLPIPVPPMDKQIWISQRITNVKQQAEQLRSQAEADLESAKLEIEAIIIGKKKSS